ncbi:MAG TPA: biotin/lipoyl-containing protein [Pyrinomonadaceae bacterium]|nr:biotin/lipoyl-containing protein [Pyrinomonadaceae bacterium]
MKLLAEIAGTRHEVHINVDGSQLIAVIDGRRYEIEARESRPGVYLLLADDHVYECRVERGGVRGEAASVHIGDHHYAITLTDPKRLRGAQSSGAQTDGSVRIIAPMPGKVVRVLVETGAQVGAGDGVIVVEAMKMQNEMKSPKAGTVRMLHTEAGATVNAGDVLAIIE